MLLIPVGCKKTPALRLLQTFQLKTKQNILKIIIVPYGHGYTMWGQKRYTAKCCEHGPGRSALETADVEQRDAAAALGLGRGTAPCRGAAFGTKAEATVCP